MVEHIVVLLIAALACVYFYASCAGREIRRDS